MVDDEDASYFRVVSEYIHLNPADAGLAKPGQLSRYLWSSYPLYLQPASRRPDWLKVQSVLSACGIPNDSLKSRRAYEGYMDLRHQSIAANQLSSDEQMTWKHMERGWIHGSRTFRDRMTACLEAQDKSHMKSLVDAEQKRDLTEAAAHAVLNRCLKHFGIELDTPFIVGFCVTRL